jgi:hypothetical protein
MSTTAWLAGFILVAASPVPVAGHKDSSPMSQGMGDYLKETLGTLGEGSSLADCGKQRVYRALYAPSFAPPLIVLLRLDELSAMGNESPAGTVDVITVLDDLPAGHREVARHRTTLRTSQAVEMAARLSAIAPETLQDSVQLGLDGMSVWGSVCSPGRAQVDFESWSPDPASRHGLFFRALLELVRSVEADEPSLFAAESALIYLAKRGELIYADTGGNPRIIRLTSISSDNAEPFRALVRSVGPEVRLIIDLRNFSGAGTMFAPEFRALDRRASPTVWVLQRPQWDYLIRNFGISKKNLVESMPEAERRLR